MNKSELVAELATRTGLTKARCFEVVDALFGTDKLAGIIPATLSSGQKVVITGFGTFGTRERAERTGTNPANGQKLRIRAKSRAYFRAGKSLKGRIER